MVAWFLHTQATCETGNFVQTGHLEFSLSPQLTGFFLLQKCWDRSGTVNENLKCTKLYSIKLELLDSMKSRAALLVFIVSE